MVKVVKLAGEESANKKQNKTSKKKPANTKNLVLQMKKIFKRVVLMLINQLKGNSLMIQKYNSLLHIQSKLQEQTNILILRSCMQIKVFQDKMQSLKNSGELLKMLIQGRMQHKNLCNCLRYYNNLVNGIYKPQLMKEGFWTQYEVEGDQADDLDVVDDTRDDNGVVNSNDNRNDHNEEGDIDFSHPQGQQNQDDHVYDQDIENIDKKQYSSGISTKDSDQPNVQSDIDKQNWSNYSMKEEDNDYFKKMQQDDQKDMVALQKEMLYE